MKLSKSQIQNLLESISEREGFMLIDVSLKGNVNNPVIEAFVDNETGVTAEDCETLSRKFEAALEEEILKGKKYRLDVSSPGIDRPLKYLQQYKKHVGRNFRISFIDGEEKKTFEGKLAGIDGNELTFLRKEEEIKIKFENITKAKVLISF